MIDAEKQPRALRIIFGTVPELEEQLNRMLKDYTALLWNFDSRQDPPRGVVVLLAVSEIRKQALMQGAMPGRMQ